MREGLHEHLRRLERVWARHPVYFVTTRARQGRPLLTLPSIAEILLEEWQTARDRHGWLIGRYVIMPDHVHFFAAPIQPEANLSDFMKRWKEWTSKRIRKMAEGSNADSGGEPVGVWQREFFDHLLRSRESYAQKWDYVWRNPVRQGLVPSPEQWPWQGELFPLEVVPG